MFFKLNDSQEISSPFCGKWIDLCDVQDSLFSSKEMGDGFAVALSSGDIVSPVDGTIALSFPSNHVYGVLDKYGTKYFIHIGLHSVVLEGKGFSSYVKEGDVVKQGQLLCRVDLAYLKQCDVSNVSVLLIENKSIREIRKVEHVDHSTKNIIKVKKSYED